ncbi:MAG: hypothetical protein LQ340_000665 [Diploschistes diacapsis]|nr:MAG: hypothetical protein LQ340_000665 [Diploschistes diacapsis]
MLEPNGITELDDVLDILGQQALLKIYTQICLCFPVVDASSYSSLIDTLIIGLERVSRSFPWVAGQVISEGSGEGNTGIFKIKPLAKVPRLDVKDLRDDPSAPTMDALRCASFPFRMLDESVIAPRTTLPSCAESPSDPAEVFLLQATFIKGGLILTFLGQHNAMDMTGQGHIIHLISKACRNEPFTPEELSTGNLPRRNIVPLLDRSYKQGPELARQIVKPISIHPSSNEAIAQQEAPTSPNSTWTYFTFSRASLAALKELATETLVSGYVSTDDTLSAFIWQRIMQARLHRLTPATESTFARAVDVRRYLNIPKTYTGLIQNMTYNTSTLQSLSDQPLGAIASQLRAEVDPKTSSLEYNTRALATHLSRSPDKTTVSITATLDLSLDVMLSSWAKLDCYDLDFGLGLGKPEAVRRPQFVPVESLIYLMPKALDGEIVVAVCLRDDDMDGLRKDKEFVKYGREIR